MASIGIVDGMQERETTGAAEVAGRSSLTVSYLGRSTGA